MKQILQNLRTGKTEITEVPAPECTRGMIKIKTRASLVSAGTERMLVEFSKGGFVVKATAQPDKVKQVIDKIKTEGLVPTLETVFKRLDEPLPLGYCNVGEVIEVGEGVQGFAPGDMVASNGPHAEVVCVPVNLCAKVPEGVEAEEASFTVLGAIALQGVRLLEPALGERIVVFGAGLIGLVTIQLLRASGCEVMAVDLNAERLARAEKYGATICDASSGDVITAANAWTGGKGVDGVIITASAKTDDIMHQSAEVCRKRGRIVLVGVVGLNLNRSDFYEKELTFQVSCSYGPGRYDDNYEIKGQDYPLGFVRWTEQRNFEAVLGAISSGSLKVKDLITNRVELKDASGIYERISRDAGVLGALIKYGEDADLSKTVRVAGGASLSSPAGCIAAMLGAGNFAKMTMAPALSKSGARLKYVSDLKNVAGAAHIAKKYGFEKAGSDTEAVLQDAEINTVFIATGHNSHAYLACKCLEAGKHVFVEKPLAMNEDELGTVIKAIEKNSDKQIMVGYNRRFSPYSVKIKELLKGRSEPLAMNFNCNAGVIPPDVWVHDAELGGGRIIGEACHFMDLLSFIAESPIVTVAAFKMGGSVPVQDDKMTIVMEFADGSIGNINYFGNGNKAYPKETLEVYSEGRILELDNFRLLEGFGFKGFTRMKGKMDKGHAAEFKAFAERVAKGGERLISAQELVNVSRASFAAVRAARERQVCKL
jgi:predicted dehydrogenase